MNIDRLETFCHNHRVTCEDLDELVHEVASRQASKANNRRENASQDEETDETFSEHASRINNEGLSSQLRFLVENLGETEARRALRELKP